MHSSIWISLGVVALAGCSFDLDAVPPPGEDGPLDSAIADLVKPDLVKLDLDNQDQGKNPDQGSQDLDSPDMMKPDTALKKCSGPKDCSDSLDCTEDKCDGSGVCTNPIKDGKCLIAGMCYADKTVDPSNTCRECSSGTTKKGWSNITAAKACSDNKLCTHGDTCSGGVCMGTAYTCPTDLCFTGACLGTGPAPGGCQRTANTCLVGTKCFDNNQADPTNPCKACLPAKSTTALSNANAAPQAQVFSSSSSVGPVGPEKMTDGKGEKSSCDYHPVPAGPANSSDYIRLQWTAPVKIAQISMDTALTTGSVTCGAVKSNQTLAGAALEYSTDGGSNWTPLTSVSAKTDDWSLTVTSPVSARDYRLTKLMLPTGSGNAVIFEWQAFCQ